MSQDVERWKADLAAAGWTAASATAWWDPTGGLYRGPYGAWKELQRRKGEIVSEDKDKALVQQLIEGAFGKRGQLPIYQTAGRLIEELSEQFVTALATVRREARAEGAQTQRNADAIACKEIQIMNEQCAATTLNEQSQYAYKCYAAGADQCRAVINLTKIAEPIQFASKAGPTE